jgi:hypothetical protein
LIPPSHHKANATLRYPPRSERASLIKGGTVLAPLIKGGWGDQIDLISSVESAVYGGMGYNYRRATKISVFETNRQKT